MADLSIGSVIGQYEILEQIGAGGMAKIFRARQRSLDRDVAIKVLPAYLALDAEYLARFRREANAIAQLQHPNILPVYDFGEHDGQTYIVMLLVPHAATLRERLTAPNDLATTVRIITQVADALAYAHQNGIIHRDIKPSNILMGENDWALLSDFGIARMVEGSTRLTRTGIGMGTPEYISPEQGQGFSVDGRSDLYSLGVVLFQMVTGRLPFEAETPVGTVIQHITKPVPLPTSINPAVPRQVEQVVLKSMAKDPNERYLTVAEFSDALSQAADDAMSPVQPLEGPTAPGRSAGPMVTSVIPVDPEQPTTAMAAATLVQPTPATAARKGSGLRWILAGIAGLLVLACLLGAGVVAATTLPNLQFSGIGNLAARPTTPPTATLTARPQENTATPQPPTRTPTPLVIVTGAEPTSTPTNTPEPTATPTRTPVPRPTDTPRAGPTATTPAGGGGGGGGGSGGSGGGAGRITIQNQGATTANCAFNGLSGNGQSYRVEVAPKSSETFQVEADSYNQRCVGESSSSLVSTINVPAGGSVTVTVR